MKDIYKIFADGNRRKIIKILLNGQLSVNEILNRFSIKQATLSSHLAILLKAGLVNVSKKSKYRLYSINRLALDAYLDEVNIFFEKNAKERVNVDFVGVENMSRR